MTDSAEAAGQARHGSARPIVGSTQALFESAADVQNSPVPAVVLEVPTERIVAASPAGALLLDPDGGTVVGRNFEDFTTDGPSGVLELFASGRVTGYEATRMLRRTGQQSLAASVWIHKFDHQARSRFALAVFSVPTAVIAAAQASPQVDEPVVVGTTDTSLAIERISDDASEVFGFASSELLGQPLTSVVAEDERAELTAAVHGAAATKRAVTLRLRARTRDGVSAPATLCQVVISPLEQPPSCAFVLMPVPDISAVTPTYSPDLAGLLLRLQRSAAIAGTVRRLSELTERDVPGLSELSTREWEIVSRLLDGERVPAIGSALNLSPSTVQSHLALVLGKLNLGSQQQLLDLLRRKGGVGT